MERIPNPALDRLHEGKLSLGCGLRMARTIEIARTLAGAGYDFMFIDLEHGTIPPAKLARRVVIPREKFLRLFADPATEGGDS